MPTGIKVKDAMVSDVVTAVATQTVLDASKIMKENDVGSVIVVENNKPIGIVTREDIVNKVTAENKLPEKVLLNEVMSKNIVSCPSSCDIAEAAKEMSRCGFERIPIIDAGKLVGIISTREIAKVGPAVIEILTEHLRIEEPERFEEEAPEGGCELCGNYSDKLISVNGKWVCDTCKDEAEL